MYVLARRSAHELELTLAGEWHAAQFVAIEAELRGVDLTGAQQAVIGTQQAQFDLSGAWLLRDFLHRVQAAGMTWRFLDAPPPALTLVERSLTATAEERAGGIEWLDPELALEDLGRRAVRGARNFLSGLNFIGATAVTAARALISLRRLRPVSVARHVYDTGITALPIVALIAFLISVILAYMGAQELRRFGADIFVVDLVTIGVLRELGVLLTAIIVAGRSGSAYAAELGAMQLNEEVDALQAIGVDPLEVLVLPRLLGLVIAMPLLTMVADVIGLIGGGLLCHVLLGMPLTQYLNRAQSAISATTFWVGMIKAPVFAVLIAAAGCYCGLRVHGSSRNLGRFTTLAVVQSIFFVILADALFAVLFMELDL